MSELVSRRLVLPRPRATFARRIAPRSVNLQGNGPWDLLRRNLAISFAVFGGTAAFLAALPAWFLVPEEPLWEAVHWTFFGAVGAGFVALVLAVLVWPRVKWVAVAIPILSSIGAWISWIWLLEPVDAWLSEGVVKPAFSTAPASVVAGLLLCGALLVPSRG